MVADFVLDFRIAFTAWMRFITSGMLRSSLGGQSTSQRHQRGMLLMNSSAPKKGRIHLAA